MFDMEINHDQKQVLFDASKSLKNGAKVDEYIWQFGEEEQVTTTSPSTDFVFSDYGTYVVTLKTVNSAGEASTSKEVSLLNLPVPDPGDDGKLDFEGIDSDGDGLRDDVQREAYKVSGGDQELYELLKRFSKKIIKNAQNANDVANSIQRTKDSINLERCLASKMGATEKTQRKIQLLKVQMFNTKERLLAWARTRVNFSGQIVDAVDADRYHEFCPE